MAIIESDNPEIEKELLKLERLISEGGGGLHSDLLIHCQEGNLSLRTKEPMKPGKELVRLSRGVLLPDDQYEVSIKDRAFIVNFPKKSSLSTLQQKLAETMMALYTMTDKVALQKQYSFQLSIGPYPGLMDKIAGARQLHEDYLESQRKIEKGLKGAALDQFICESFLKTRHLGYSDLIRISSVRVLMPVIDFFNHHWLGSAFNIGQGVRQGDLVVENRQPVPESLECYAIYGIMDSLDSLLRYDFIDESAPIVRSVPIELDVPGKGKIIINSLTGAMNKKKLAKEINDLNRYMPIAALNKKENTITASHLLIPTGGSPMALRRILVILLTKLTGDVPNESFRKAWLREAELKIMEKNNAYYKEVLEHVKKLIEEKGESPGLEQLRRVFELQLSKLAQYKCMDQLAA